MKKNKSVFAPIISGIYKKISCMKIGTIKNNNKLQVTKSEFVNDYLTDEEQEIFRKRISVLKSIIILILVMHLLLALHRVY